MMDYFACLATPRSGSTMLIRTLGLHPDITAFGEIFSHGPKVRKFSTKGICPHIQNHENHLEFLQKLNNLTSTKYFAFKLHYIHVVLTPWKSFHQDLIDNNIPLVILKRKNSLKQALSRQLAKFNMNWSRNEYEKHIHVLPEKAIYDTYAYKNQNQKYHDIFKNYQNKVELIYEDVVQNPQKEFNKIFDMLKLKKYEIKLATKKQTKKHVLDYINNTEELLTVVCQKAPELLKEIDVYDFKPLKISKSYLKVL